MLDDLIDQLSSTEISLTSILLKTKVLSFSIDQPELVKWVNAELNGYKPSDKLPEYRFLHAQVRGAIRSLTAFSDNHPLPTKHLSEEQRKSLEKIEFREPVTVVEDLLRRHGEDKTAGHGFQYPIPMEANPLFAKALTPGWVVNTAWCEVEPSQMAAITTQVRSRLLDFLLVLRAEVGENASNKQIKEKTYGLDVGAAFQGAVFRGENVVINVGDNNRLKVTNISIRSDDQLFAALTELGVSKTEITALKQAIAADKKEGGSASLGGATGTWYQNLLAKAKKGASKVSVEVVSGTVAGLILEYIKNSG